MEQPTTIGIDLAKTVFQGSSVKRSIRGIDRSEERVDADGAAILRRKLRRGQVLEFFERLEPCLVGMEACAFGGRAVPRTPR